MARATIKQRITLEGGKEIEAQLEALGKAGEKAFQKISNAAVKADLAKFGQSLNRFGSDLATVGRRASIAFAALGTAATAAAAAVFGLATSAAEQADEAGKAAEATGLQIDAYGRLSFAAQMANVSQEEFATSMSRLNVAIQEAAEGGVKASGALQNSIEAAGKVISEEGGRSVTAFDLIGVTVTRLGNALDKTKKESEESTGRAAAAFRQLGVSVRDAGGRLRDTEDILGDLADAFSRMPDSSTKSALAIALFGRAGARLLPFLNAGRKGLRELGLEAERLGIVFTKEQAAIGDALGDALDGVKFAVSGVRNQLGLLFAPAITEAAEKFRDLIADNRDVIVAFGRAVVDFGISIVRDLIAALSGRDAQVTRPWILEWRDAIVAFGQDVTAVVNGVIIPLFNAVRTAAKLVADSINAVFGTDISAGQVAITAAFLKLMGVFALLRSSIELVVSAFRLLLTTMIALGSSTVAVAFFTTLRTAALGFLAIVGGLVSWPALLIAAIATAAVAVVLFWDEVKAGASAAFTFVSEQAAALWEGLVEAFEGARAAVVAAFQSIVSDLSGIGTQIGEAIARGFEAGVNRIKSIFTDLKNFISNGVSELLGFVQRLIDRIAAAAARIGSILSGSGSSGDSSSGSKLNKFAGGGTVRGAGTGTSDSILAWLSNGEFVTRARAVAYYGPDLFNALNDLRLPKDFLRGFSMGGLVDGIARSISVPVPKFAMGGLVAGAPSGRPVNVTLAGETFAMTAPEDVAEKMIRAVQRQSIRSGGRRPGWFR